VARAPKTQSSRRPWASDDVKMLKSMARKEPASQIAKALKRTEGATRQKATALGISQHHARTVRGTEEHRAQDRSQEGGAEEGCCKEGAGEEGCSQGRQIEAEVGRGRRSR
jgi:hypothetical protein